MHEGSPRRWPYSANNSPLALPEHPILFTSKEVVLLDDFAGEMSDEVLQGTSAPISSDLAVNPPRLTGCWPVRTQRQSMSVVQFCFKESWLTRTGFKTSISVRSQF